MSQNNELMPLAGLPAALQCLHIPLISLSHQPRIGSFPVVQMKETQNTDNSRGRASTGARGSKVHSLPTRPHLLFYSAGDKL